jgi:Holliday junction DNA helicase RuvB
LNWLHEDGVPELLAGLSKGVPRNALRLLQASYRVARSAGDRCIAICHARTAIRLEGIDDVLGLSVQEQRYLQAVANGYSKLGVISSRIAMPTSTVQRVVEPFLIRSGLVIKDGSTRQLSAYGHEYLTRQLTNFGKEDDYKICS